MDFTYEELDLLLHFAILGQNSVIVRNNHGDHEVAKQLNPVIERAYEILWKKDGF